MGIIEINWRGNLGQFTPSPLGVNERELVDNHQQAQDGDRGKRGPGGISISVPLIPVRT